MHHLGHTLSANRRDHLLLTPDTFIRTPLPELTGGMAIVHVGPQVGAGFTQMTLEMGPGAVLREGPAQRLVYVLEGDVTLHAPLAGPPSPLAAGGFAFLPQGFTHRITAGSDARMAVIEKPYQPLDEDTARSLRGREESALPWFCRGQESDLAAVALNGDEALQVRALLPTSPAFDFACNTMTYEPGASLSQVEIHYMEHGLLMLEGGGIYRLGDQWYPTQAGDFIWMAPFCPQWFGALGKKPAKYLIYKDFNRHPMG